MQAVQVPQSNVQSRIHSAARVTQDLHPPKEVIKTVHIKPVRCSVELDSTLHMELKIHCVRKGIQLKDFFGEAIKAHARKHKISV